MRHYTAPTQVVPLVQAGLENPAVVEEMPVKDRPDNADFDREPVKPTTYKEPEQNPLTLLDSFQEQIVYFQGSPGLSANVNNYGICEIPGPKAGYYWDLRRFVISFPNVINGLVAASSTPARAGIYAVPAGALSNLGTEALNTSLPLTRWRFLTNLIYDATKWGIWGLEQPQTYSRLQMTLLAGWSLGVLYTGDVTMGNPIIEGQAVEIPEALLRRIK